jgi:hypothetical protein
MSDRPELYQSPNGDTWHLGREPTNGRAFVIHQPNGPSGGRLRHVELGAFLSEQLPRPLRGSGFADSFMLWGAAILSG